MSDLVEQVAWAIAEEIGWGTFSHFDPNDMRRISRAALSVLEPRIEALEAENFKLAAGACNVEGGLIGDDHGHLDCSLKARIEALERELAEARGALEHCATQLQIERDHLFDCCTVAGDPETLDELAKPDIARMDEALSKAHTTLRKLDGERGG